MSSSFSSLLCSTKKWVTLMDYLSCTKMKTRTGVSWVGSVATRLQDRTVSTFKYHQQKRDVTWADLYATVELIHHHRHHLDWSRKIVTKSRNASLPSTPLPSSHPQFRHHNSLLLIPLDRIRCDDTDRRFTGSRGRPPKQWQRRNNKLKKLEP